MNTAKLLRVKVGGTGVITRRCNICGKPIKGEPVLIHRDGRLVTFHADCHTKEN